MEAVKQTWRLFDDLPLVGHVLINWGFVSVEVAMGRSP
jgi:hypothetical protein